MPRLRRVSSAQPGWTRRRSGRGFVVLDQHGARVTEEDRARVNALAIPPAWTEVWICPHPLGHLQAVGTDDAGRRQYLYHPVWRERRDVAKFAHVLEVGRALPDVRRSVARDVRTPGLERAKVLALAVRLVDLGAFRLGAESYLDEHGSHGLTTLQRQHVRSAGDGVEFRFTGKSGVEQEVVLADPEVTAAVRELTAHRRADAPLLAWRDGRRRVGITPVEVNDHLKALFATSVEEDVTAKDLRTWQATALAAAVLAEQERAATKTARRRQVRAAMVEVAEHLGNTPTVARTSYVDPRVVDLFESGVTVDAARAKPFPRTIRQQNSLDRAVVELLS